MKQRVLLAAIFGLLLSACLRAGEEPPLSPAEMPALAPVSPLILPPVTQLKTSEGLTVWIVPRPGYPKVTAMLTIRGGNAADPKELPGVATLLAETLKSGTLTRSSKQLAEESQALGGGISSSASVDAVFLTVEGLSWGSPRLLSMLADIARHSSFPPEEVELAKANALTRLRSQLSTPEYLGAKALALALYRDHPYHTVLPTLEAIPIMTSEILRREFRRRFRPERALLVIIGDLDVGEMKELVSKNFHGWRGDGETVLETPPSPTAVEHTIFLVDRPGSVQSLLMVAGFAPKMGAPDYYPLLVANTLLGGSPGSRLTKNLREDKGYTYAPESQVATREIGGRWFFRAFVRNEVTAASLNETRYEIDRLATVPLGENELSAVKRYLCGRYLLDNQRQTAFAATLASAWISGLAPDALAEFVTQVGSVTAADVQRAVQRFLLYRKLLVLVVGDRAQVKPALEQLGVVTELTP